MKKNILKEIFLLLCVLTVIFICCSPAFASVNHEEQEVYIEVPIITVENLDEWKEFQTVTLTQDDTGVMPAIDGGGIGFFLIRSYNTEDVEVYFQWAGTEMLNKVRCTNLTVDDGSLLKPVIYDTLEIGSGIYTQWGFPAAYSGTAKLHDVKILLSQTSARVRATNLMVYSLESGWQSVNYIGKSGLIN